MPQVGSERSQAAYEAYLKSIAASDQQKKGKGGELIDTSVREMPADVGISGEMQAGSEKPASVKHLESKTSFITELARLEGETSKIDADFDKAYDDPKFDKYILIGDLTRFSDKMNVVEDMIRDAGGTDSDVENRIGSHRTQYDKWYKEYQALFEQK